MIVTTYFWRLLAEGLANGGWPAVYFYALTPITLVVDAIYLTGLLIIDTIKFTYLLETEVKNKTWSQSQRRPWLNVLANVFEPLTGFGKTFIDSFKPYKYGFDEESKRIVQQLPQGLAYVLSGLFRVITAPIVGLTHSSGLLLSLIGRPSQYGKVFNKLSTVISNMVSVTINGACRVIAGVAHIAFTPFAWTLKPLLRLLISATSETPLIEKNDGMKTRLETTNFAADKPKEQRLSTYADIHRKFQKCLARGEATAIDNAQEEIYYNNLVTENDDVPGDELVTQNEINYFNLMTNHKHGVYQPLPRALAMPAQRIQQGESDYLTSPSAPLASM